MMKFIMTYKEREFVEGHDRQLLARAHYIEDEETFIMVDNALFSNKIQDNIPTYLLTAVE